MTDGITVTYEGHSGFSARTKNHLLVFDTIRPIRLTKEDHALVFVSHAHSDHCLSEAREWAAHGLCRLIAEAGTGLGGFAVKRGDCLTVDGVSVRVFGSTDEGVSFLAEADGCRIFHAGDFNFWHWKEESTPEEIAEARRLFDDALSDMDGLKPDIAFFPIDPRMGADCDEGALLFAERVCPAVLIPMHFWDNPRPALDFAGKNLPDGVRARVMTHIGEQLTEGRREE